VQGTNPTFPRESLKQSHRRKEKVMPVLKSPPKQLRSATIQVRVEEEISFSLRKYAEFIGCSPAYVVSEALKILFKKDNEFREWIAQHGDDQHSVQAERTQAVDHVKR
jgi:hypothetical protein